MLRWTRLVRTTLVLGVLGTAVLAAGPARAAGPTVTAKPAGIAPINAVQDDRLVIDADPAARVRLLANAGARVIRVDLRWDLVATARPASPTSPNDPAYVWGRYDAIVAAAQANRVQVLFTVYGTPAWARDPSVSVVDGVPGSAIRPLDPADYGNFGAAAAARYAPMGVHRWEEWNEANIALFLWPQYQNTGGTWTPVSPTTYAGLARAFYQAVKAVDPAAVIAGGVTAPVGDRTCTVVLCPTSPRRVQPDAFIKALNAPGLRPPMDVVSHHPYPLTKPRASTPPTASYVDLYNLTRFVKAVDSTYLAKRKLWLTEYGFATEPVTNYRTFFSRAQQANFIADAFRRIRANPRVQLASYYHLQDHADWRSGVLDQAGRRKPGYAALALPFAQERPATVRRGAATTLVGQVRQATGKAKVRIEWRSGGTWRLARQITTGADGTFKISVRSRTTVGLRAKWTGATRSGARVTTISPTVTIKVR